MSYVSYKLAMNYLLNNKSIFNRIRKSFLTSYANYEADFQKILDSKNFDDIEQYIHSIKGISLNLGAKILYDTSVSSLDQIKNKLWDEPVFLEFFTALKETYLELESFNDE